MNIVTIVRVVKCCDLRTKAFVHKSAALVFKRRCTSDSLFYF